MSEVSLYVGSSKNLTDLIASPGCSRCYACTSRGQAFSTPVSRSRSLARLGGVEGLAISRTSSEEECLQGYLAHEQTPKPLGPAEDLMHRNYRVLRRGCFL